MTTRWHIRDDMAEHLCWPRCRFYFQRDPLGAWWRLRTAWLDDPVEQIDDLGADGLARLITELAAEAERRFEHHKLAEAEAAETATPAAMTV
jgi:hypothetical protein